MSLRSGRGSKKADNNNGRAFTGRVGVSPRLGTEFGVSVHTGDYDADGERRLTIAALDAMAARGPFEILGEAALATAGVAGAGDAEGALAPTTVTGREDAEAALATTTMAGRENAEAAGFYLEGRVHFLSGAISALPLSVFTGTVRADYVDHDRNTDGSDRQRLTVGVNFRPTEQTVFKNDVLFDRNRGAGASDWSDTETAYRFSIASYF